MRKRKKRKGITSKKDHLGPYYLVRVTRKHPATGEEIERRCKVRDTFARAEAIKDELARELEAEIEGKLSPKTTLGAYAQQWLEHKAGRLAASTNRKYVNDLEKHILPALGRMRLDELTPSHVRAMFAKDTGADTSKLNRLRVLRSIAKDAVADRLITWDFTARITIHVEEIYTDEQPNLLTSEKLDQLLDNFDEEWLDGLYVLAFTGMRWCELAGLKWKDIDLEKAELRIRRANVKGILGPPKTKKSRRSVGLAKEVAERLKARLARMKAANHPTLADDGKGWVFPKEDGDHHRGYPMRKALERASKAVGIEFRFTTHGLRRTYNNLARRLVDNLLVLRATVGHASESMTEHYSHVGVDEKRALSERVVDQVRNRHSDRHSDPSDTPPKDPKPQ